MTRAPGIKILSQQSTSHEFIATSLSQVLCRHVALGIILILLHVRIIIIIIILTLEVDHSFFALFIALRVVIQRIRR